FPGPSDGLRLHPIVFFSSGSGLTADSLILTLTLAFLDFGLDFAEYDQKLEALTNFNVSEAFEKAVQARVLTEIKKLLPTHIPNAVANYVRPRLNTSVLEQALNDQDAEPSFHKRSHDNQDLPNNLHAQVDTPAIQPLDLEDEYIWTRLNPEWYTKLGSAVAAKRKITWFNLLLKSNIDQNDFHILRPSTFSIAKKIKAIIQKDELTIADLEGAGLERLKQQYQNDVELEYHVDQLKAAVLTEAKWNSDEDEVSKPITRSDDKEYEFSYADLPRLSLNHVEDMYLLQVQDKLHYIPLEFMKDFNNALLLFIKRVVIQDRVEDIQLGVERVVYLNQHNVKSFMKLSEVKKFCNGTLIKIRENLVDIVKKNKQGTGNKILKGRE
ncbi:hypothetical protein Tco_1414522, partial [Tanacetum coccineum]